MIDFRYHLVSLISVFLALAVGIALGAGPLKETIGDQLTGQVEQLRAEKDALSADLNLVTAQRDGYTAYLDAASAELVGGLLPRDVAVVTLPGADADAVAAINDRLEQAGATVTASLAVTEDWTAADKRDFRASLVTNVLGYLESAPAADAAAEDVLGAAFAQTLTAADAADAAALSENARVLLDVLEQGGLVTVEQAPTAPVAGVVVVGPAAAGSGPSATPTASPDDAELLAVVGALGARAQGTVVAGPAVTADQLVSQVRADGALTAEVSTVDSINDVTGQISVPRALSAAIAGTLGQYGFGTGATAVLPPLVALPAAATVGTAG